MSEKRRQFYVYIFVLGSNVCVLLTSFQLSVLNFVLDFQVSGRVLSEVLARNRNLQDLNIRGCTQVALYPFDYFLIQKSLKWVSLEVGWGIPSSVDAFSMFGILSELENLAIGVGGTVSGHSLLRISEDCTRLKRLSLSFQVGSYSVLPYPCLVVILPRRLLCIVCTEEMYSSCSGWLDSVTEHYESLHDSVVVAFTR